MHIHLLTALAASVMNPGSFQDLEALDARIAMIAGGSGRSVPIDKRIRLAACPQDPEISPAAAGAVAVRCPALGWKIRVALVGSSAPDVAAEPVIHKGDTIELTAQGAGYSATSVGTALDEGAAGTVIRVKIPTSASPLSAMVARAGVATLSD